MRVCYPVDEAEVAEPHLSTLKNEEPPFAFAGIWEPSGLGLG